ncbi:hypothetical protein I6G96_13285 [Delftia acidovorans]|uniref:STM4504/CBY_0614 family protein n=1 Tax=Delftia acidovorans TaxID=80866 RepID=UPI0018D6A426|nr:hypothetical protein [Delftia acidovorans]QPR37344.1 hypothetical protein I6G96_13285 [Delftia acidovorans]
MGIVELFSKRQRKNRGEFPEVFVYDKLPTALRVQIVHLIKDAFGTDQYGSHSTGLYSELNEVLCREYGLFRLHREGNDCDERLFNFILQTDDIEKCLDAVELCFRLINNHIAGNLHYLQATSRKINPEDAVSDLNKRFREHGVGYQFEITEIIRVDSQFIHSEIVKPALILLSGSNFIGASEEFFSAHEHYRHGKNKECLVDCLKALESTIKSICIAKGWEFRSSDTAKNLINICFTNGLLHTSLDSQFTSLRSLLESGVPTVRNKFGGHGQGAEVVEVPNHITRYALNLTATSIYFLVDAFKGQRE